MIFIGKGLFQCNMKFIFVFHAVHAHRRTTTAGLDHARIRKVFRQYQLFFTADRDACRCRDMVAPEHFFGNALIHAESTAGMPGSGIADAIQIEQCLDPAVLAAFSMKAEEYNIAETAKLQYIWT